MVLPPELMQSLLQFSSFTRSTTILPLQWAQATFLASAASSVYVLLPVVRSFFSVFTSLRCWYVRLHRCWTCISSYQEPQILRMRHVCSSSHREGPCRGRHHERGHCHYRSPSPYWQTPFSNNRMRPPYPCYTSHIHPRHPPTSTCQAPGWISASGSFGRTAVRDQPPVSTKKQVINPRIQRWRLQTSSWCCSVPSPKEDGGWTNDVYIV